MSGLSINKEWSLDFDFSAALGETYTRFMEGLKEKKLVGNRCGDRIFFPPLPFCTRTFEQPDEWLESDGTGRLEAFTVCHQNWNNVVFSCSEEPLSLPYVIGVIRVDNSDQCLVHFLRGFDTSDPEKILQKVKLGLRVRPVWKKERSGNILDIAYFEPVA
jgi:uncharacterized protein